jgi:hypothetical protein
MQTSAVKASDVEVHAKWWREPYFWLVVGGPVVVVVAALFTAGIAVKNPDPVLDAANAQQAIYMQHAKEAQLSKEQITLKARNQGFAPVSPSPK